VYDPSHRVVLLHGGQSAQNSEADTWTWDATRWDRLNHRPRVSDSRAASGI
jgi:hypothetical protein